MSPKLLSALFVPLAFLCGFANSHAGNDEALDWQDNARISEIFEQAGVAGTFVLYDPVKNQLTGHGRSRANTRYPPASTFKIPNTLIGLSTGAVGNVDEVLPYGGEPQRFKSWERDMNLREAIVASNVPVYQGMARNVGLDRMRDHVAQIHYGNSDIGTSVDTFWLAGPLAISAVEQTRFLAKLADGALPYPAELQASVREISELEQHDGATLYGKTGWAFEAGIGWWVGWVEKDGHTYPFALNIDMQDIADASKRIELGKASLTVLGLYP